MPPTSADAAPALTAEFLRSHFAVAKRYDDYVATGAPDKREAWARVYEAAELSEAQRALLGGFTRRMRILVVSGVWCGDCVQQVPFIERFARATGEVDGERLIDVRYADRDEHADLAGLLKICGGMRVPVAVIMAEDFEPCSVFGDRTLSRYRAMAARALGASCQLPGAPVDGDELRATLQDWLDEVERVQLMLRLSTRLRQKHGD